MIAFLADENFHSAIIRGLRRREPDVDVVRVQDVGLSGADDVAVLAWAASHGRVLLTHDVKTIAEPAYERVDQGLAMPGVFVVPDSLPLGDAIRDLVLVAECSEEGEWENNVHYLPL